MSFRPADLGHARKLPGARREVNEWALDSPGHVGAQFAHRVSTVDSRPEYRPHALGRWGERTAAAALERRGWRILERGYRLGRREVDLIIRREKLIAFVEVKTRAGSGYGAPEEAVTWAKRREIEAVAQDFLMRRRLGEVDVRFDVIAIVVGTGRRIVRFEHIEDAWRP